MGSMVSDCLNADIRNGHDRAGMKVIVEMVQASDRHEFGALRSNDDEADLEKCEACGKPMPVGTYAVDENGVAACLPVMSDGEVEGPCADLMKG
jgi:hypothetical protein